MAIGLNQFSAAAVEEVDLPYASGDILFFYSDGLSEIMDEEGQQLGHERLQELLQSHAGLSPAEIRQKILDFSIAFAQSESPADDLTFVLVKVL